MEAVPARARPFVLFVCLSGTLCLVSGTFPWHRSNVLLFATYLTFTALASGWKSALPGLEGTVSVNDVFFLLGICTLTLSETLVLAVIPTVIQCFWRSRKRLGFIHFAFNLSQVALAITAAYWSYRTLLNQVFHGRATIALLIAAVVYFFVNTIAVATVVALAEGTSIRKKWMNGYAWTFPYCLVGAAIAGMIQLVNRMAGWEMSILVLPVVYAVYRSYRMQLGRWDDEKRHLQDLASLHMRTIETLALAIEAKDHTTGDHLQRVRVYAMELARDLGLSDLEAEALNAAAVLHDIGKLAVPEHIISKPGKLTPEEFEKMKIHPIVGAEILEQVKFPYPVAAVVRSHHEKWDGSGYPDGLAGEAIPIGARILSAVDCLDALASDRQYRRALPLDQAMAQVEADAGRAFDPRVVAALKARYIELEEKARSRGPQERPTLSIGVKVTRGAAPAAGFAAIAEVPFEKHLYASPNSQKGPRNLSGGIPDSASSLEEIFSTSAVRLRHLVPYDAMAVFVSAGDLLVPRFVLGENWRQLSRLCARLGEGLIGWVAETGNYMVNGNPTVEPGYIEEIGKSVELRSALAIPLQHHGCTVGVLALYSVEPDAFTSAHLGFLQLICDPLGAAIGKSFGEQNHSPAVAHAAEGKLLTPSGLSAF